MINQRKQTRKWFLSLLFIICVAFFLILVKAYWDRRNIHSTPVPMLTCMPTSDSDKEVLSAKLRSLANNFLDLQHSPYTSAGHARILGNQVEMVNNMMRILQHGEGSAQRMTEESKKQEVCPEQFDYHQPGFSRVKCTEFVPIHQLITLLMYVPNELSKPAMNYLQIMLEISKYYPEIRVVLATNKKLPKGVMKTISMLKILFQNKVIEGNKGSMWAKMVNEVETPYVLIAPYITHFDNDIDLHRLVRVLSYRDDVAVSGGSFRNLAGHWDLGCRQASLNYWTAKYTAGYFRSFNECVVCDYLPGPFAAKTKLLKRLKFDTR